MIELLMDRKRAIAVAVEVMNLPASVWEAVPGVRYGVLADGDENIGFMMFDGPEVHIGIRESHRGKWYSRALCKRVLGPVMHEHGRLVTKVRESHESGQRFVERFGFKRAGVEAGNVLYVLEASVNPTARPLSHF